MGKTISSNKIASMIMLLKDERKCKKMRTTIFMITILLAVLLNMTFSSAQGNVSSSNESKPYIDPAIYAVFESNEWVDIAIVLYNISEANVFTSNFSEDELKITRISSRWIVAQTTIDGINKLANDTRIKEIFFNSPVQGTDSENKTINQTINNTEGKSIIDNLPWLIIIVIIIIIIVLYSIIKFKK